MNTHQAPTAPADPVEEYIAKYSNWGRWGDDDELGATNEDLFA